MPIIIVRKGKALVKELPRPPPQPLLDGMVRNLIEAHPNLLVAYFLICSWLYYVKHVSIISDALFDEICETLYAHWDDIDHPHKKLIDRDALQAGTGYYIPHGDYPGMTRAAAAHLVNNNWPGVHLSADDGRFQDDEH